MTAVVFGEPIPQEILDSTIAYYCGGCGKPVGFNDARRPYCPHCGYGTNSIDEPDLTSTNQANSAIYKCEMNLENLRAELTYHQAEVDRIEDQIEDLEAEVRRLRRLR
jgi:ribosomal protein L37E